MRAHAEGDYLTAVQELERAADLGFQGHEPAKVYKTLGNSYHKTDRFDKAIVTYRKWLEIDPKSYDAWVMLSDAYRDAGDIDEAERCLEKALTFYPRSARLYAKLGRLSLVKDYPERAVENLQSSICLDPDVPGPYADLAWAFAALGRFEEAESSYQAAVMLGYKDANILRQRLANLKRL
jgi:tetratricopeptide (TPR) repeat protein